MLERQVLIPILFVCVFAAPILYHQSNSQTASEDQFENQSSSSYYQQEDRGGQNRNFFLPSQKSSSSPYLSWNDESSKLVPSTAEFAQGSASHNFFLASQSSSPQILPGDANMHQPSAPWNGGRGFDWQQNADAANSFSYSGSFGNQQLGGALLQNRGTLYPQPINQFSADPVTVAGHVGGNGTWVPDYGLAETFYFPGNEFGPDFSTAPLENLPVWDFNEIFNFEITQDWVRRRWKRVSTTPFDKNFSGMRVPLVTGTQSWDLHGSMTYFFDKNQRLQRITFRGWTGDPQKLIQILTNKFQLKAQPTTLAGFYLAKHRRVPVSGMMMKFPPVLDSSQRHQQLGIVLEINRPEGGELSQDFTDLIIGSHPDI